MQPVAVSPEAERGYYVIWNAETWARMRVSSVAFVLYPYADPIAARAHPLLRGSRDLPRTPSRTSFLGAKMWAYWCSRNVLAVLSATHDGRCTTTTLFPALYLLMLSDQCQMMALLQGILSGQLDIFSKAGTRADG